MRTAGPALLRLALLAAAAYALLVGLAWVFQRKMMYFPDREDPARPPGAAYGNLGPVELVTDDDVRLQAWWWPGSRDAALLVLHGNAGHRGHRLGWVEPFHRLGWGVFLLDYRGYGGSAGEPSEEGLIADARAARAWLDEHGPARVAYLGESIGCSVAVALAAQRPPDALVLQSGADSLVAVAGAHYRWLPVGLLMRDRWDSVPRLAEVHAPLLSIHGDRDGIVPIERGRALHDAHPGPHKEWFVVEGAGHNDLPWIEPRRYVERVHRFLERHLTTDGQGGDALQDADAVEDHDAVEDADAPDPPGTGGQR